MKLKIFFIILIIFLILFPNLYSQENVYIELKIEDEIITKYLKKHHQALFNLEHQKQTRKSP